MIRRPRLALLLVLAPLAIAASACPGGGGGDDDDDDDVATTPVNVDVCQIVWASADATVPAVFDIFLVDADRSDWTSGTVEYAVSSPIGVLYNEKALPSDANPNPVPASAAITTAGSFQLTLGNGTETAGSISFSDVAGQEFYDLHPVNGTITGRVGTGGAMSFEGEWSDPLNPDDLTEGTGIANILYLDSSLQLGTYGSYAICYQAGTTFQARAAATLDRVLRRLERRAQPPATGDR